MSAAGATGFDADPTIRPAQAIADRAQRVEFLRQAAAERQAGYGEALKVASDYQQNKGFLARLMEDAGGRTLLWFANPLAAAWGPPDFGRQLGDEATRRQEGVIRLRNYLAQETAKAAGPQAAAAGRSLASPPGERRGAGQTCSVRSP